MTTVNDFTEKLKTTPIEKTLRVDGNDYDFISSGEITQEVDEEFIVIDMYCQEDGEVIIRAEVDIEMSTGDMMDYTIIQKNIPVMEYERPYHYLETI